MVELGTAGLTIGFDDLGIFCPARLIPTLNKKEYVWFLCLARVGGSHRGTEALLVLFPLA